MNLESELTNAASPNRKLSRLLTAVLTLAVINTAYLSWRYIALHADWVKPGTSICSWSEGIDCDKVLLAPQARAFYVPNALLGFGFFFGCLIWWTVGLRLGLAYRRHIIRTLAFWLGLATVFTFYFFWLLIHLDALCPLCPWSHVLTYVALVVALKIWRLTPPIKPEPLKPLLSLVILCVAQFWAWQALWFLAHRYGIL